MIRFCVLALAAAAFAQTPDVTIRSTVQEVMLDLVVRDRHERLVQDLKPADLEIYVDGILQPVRGFRIVSGREQVDYERNQAAAAAQGKPVQKLPGLNLVAIVFSAMSPRSRDFAGEAAAEFLKNELLPNTYAAVFSLDYNLNALAPFTNDREKLVAAVKRAATGNYSQFPAESARILNHIDTQVVGVRGGTAVVSNVDPFATAAMSTAGAETGYDLSARIFSGIMHRSMLDAGYQYGMRTLTSLLTMTRAMAKLPGRKTILYMSEGLVLPPGNTQMLQVAISEANRSNVSFYLVDTRGLTTASVGQASKVALDNVSSVAQTQSDTGQIALDNFRQDDLVMYTVQTANTQGPMAELADNTGGFLIANTNTLKKPMARIMEDVRTHYELTFAPTSTNYDGRFRKIEVKLLRPGLHAQSRSGYFALPFLNGESVLPYELPALEALNAKAAPHAFDYRAAAFRFRPGPAFTQCALAFEVPIANLEARESGKTARLHASLLALVKDAAGQVVSKVSRDVPYEVPSEKLDMFRRGNIAITQPFELPDGVFTVETAVVDRISGRASTKRSVFSVRPSAVSSLIVARSINPLKEPGATDPMVLQGSRITPSLADTAEGGSETSLYFRIYPAENEKPELTLEFFADGQMVAHENPELPAPGADGSIPFLARTRLSPGQYVITATVKQGAAVAQESAVLNVANGS